MDQRDFSLKKATKLFHFFWHLLIPARLSQGFLCPPDCESPSATGQKASLEEREEVVVVFASLNIFDILRIVRINNVLVK